MGKIASNVTQVDVARVEEFDPKRKTFRVFGGENFGRKNSYLEQGIPAAASIFCNRKLLQ